MNVYIFYDLDAWPRNPTNNFKFTNSLFGATSVVKNSDTEKYVYTSYGITFDITGSWSFNNDTARNVIIFVIDDTSSSDADNRKNNFFVLGEGPILELMETLHHQRKSFVLILLKKAQNVA